MAGPRSCAWIRSRWPGCSNGREPRGAAAGRPHRLGQDRAGHPPGRAFRRGDRRRGFAPNLCGDAGRDGACRRSTAGPRASIICWSFSIPSERYSAARFAADALNAIDAIHARGKRTIVAGGTGFYLRALAGDVALSSAFDPALRPRLARETEAASAGVSARLAGFARAGAGGGDLRSRSVPHRARAGESRCMQPRGGSARPSRSHRFDRAGSACLKALARRAVERWIGASGRRVDAMLAGGIRGRGGTDRRAGRGRRRGGISAGAGLSAGLAHARRTARGAHSRHPPLRKAAAHLVPRRTLGACRRRGRSGAGAIGCARLAKERLGWN